MTISYDEIYSRFFIKADTVMSLMRISKEDVDEFLKEWLHSALAKPYVRRIFESLSLDDVIKTVDFEISNSVDEDADKEYIIEIAACGMVAEWLEPRVKSDENIKQFFAGKEQKFYSQSAHLAELRGLLSDAKTEVRKLIRDHGYIYNSYLNG